MNGNILNILVCEDNKFQAEMIANLLKTYDDVNAVETVHSGEELVSTVLERSDITALFIDIDLPGMSGTEAYSILKMRGKNIPAVLITATKPNASDTYPLEIVDVVEKPYLPPQIEEALRKLRLQIQYQNFIQAGGCYVPVISDRIIMLVPDEILCFESGHKEIKIHTVSETIEGKNIALKMYEDYLQKHGFVFSHRAFLVNTNKIHYIDEKGIHFKGQRELVAPVAEDKMSIVKKIVQKMNILPI